MLKKLFTVLALVGSASVMAAGGHAVHLDKAPINLKDQASLATRCEAFPKLLLRLSPNAVSTLFSDFPRFGDP